MLEKGISSGKGQFSAKVCANRQIGQRFYRLRLEFSREAAKAFENFVPGQFVQMDVSYAALPASENIPPELADAAQRNILLRRPFSFADVTTQGDKTFAELLYKAVGPASLRMTSLSTGNSISVIGPLGNGFWVPKGKKRALLIAGGMGTPPLQHLAKVLTAKYPDIEVIVFAGAKTAKDLPFERRLDEISQQLGFALPEFAKYGVKSQIATDDGTAGFAGTITDCLSQWLERTKLVTDNVIIYACGPQAMLARMAEIAKAKNIDCQVSMERMMACGIGVCQSCTVECRGDGTNPVRSDLPYGSGTTPIGTSNGASETIYKLCCEDGPVFDSREVIFSV